LIGRGREAAALVLFALALYLCLALLSLELDPHDPSVVGANWVGPVGAQVAEVLARGFGAVAWAAPLELVVVAAPLFRRQPARVSGLRIAGNLVVAIVLSALVHVATPRGQVFGRIGSGGNVGMLFGELFQALFSTLGSFLVGGTVVGLILIGRASFSFIELCRKVLELATRLLEQVITLVRRLAQAWVRARSLFEAEQARKRLERAPKIGTRRSDEAIIAQFDTTSEFSPLERTGAPPVALAESLRKQLAEADEAGRTIDTIEVPSSPSPHPAAAPAGPTAPPRPAIVERKGDQEREPKAKIGATSVEDAPVQPAPEKALLEESDQLAPKPTPRSKPPKLVDAAAPAEGGERIDRLQRIFHVAHDRAENQLDEHEGEEPDRETARRRATCVCHT
jgi:S-DNA-T family DNA segregation ATPase FtsK/SpoIIIE